MKQKLRRRAVCLLLVFCCLFGVAIFPAQADAGDTEITDARGFSDYSPVDFWIYESFVTTAVRQGLIKGYPDNSFRPNTLLTRGDAALMLYRLHQKVGKKISVSAKPEEFPDIPERSYQRGALLWASALGLLKGYSDGTLRPQKKITIGELTVLFYRYLQLLGEENRFEEAACYWDEKEDVPRWGSEAVREMSGWELFSKSGIPFDDPLDRTQACVYFVRFFEKLTFSNDESSPRLKFRVDLSGNRNVSDEEPRFLSSFQEYEEYNASLRAGFPQRWDNLKRPKYQSLYVDKIEQPVEPEITEKFFENRSLLVVEMWRDGDNVLDRELAELSFEGNTAKATFIDKYGKGHTANVGGVILLIEVPKNINRLDYKSLSWTIWRNPAPA